jgi:curli production assembly/transport component CsgE
MHKYTLCSLIIFLNVTSFLGQGVDSTNTIIDSTKSKVPESILKLVEEYDRQVKAIQKSKEKTIIKEPVLEIDGVVMDETMSKSGREFYEIFFSNWRKPVAYKNYYIKIKERPFRMNNTVIEVYLKERLLYQQMMRRRYDEVEMMAKQAVSSVERQIIKEIIAQQALIRQQQQLNRAN